MMDRLLVGVIIAIVAASFTMIVISGKVKRECERQGTLTIDSKVYNCKPVNTKPVVHILT
jgi:hypothetical protein